MKKQNMRRFFPTIVPVLCFCLCCTKLNTKIYDRVEKFWQTPEQVAAGVAPAYAGLRNYAPLNGIYQLTELSTDELIVPIRGNDWYDGGGWEEMWKHTWTPFNQFVGDGWRFIYGGI